MVSPFGELFYGILDGFCMWVNWGGRQCFASFHKVWIVGDSTCWLCDFFKCLEQGFSHIRFIFEVV